jgi:hypothetical protein
MKYVSRVLDEYADDMLYLGRGDLYAIDITDTETKTVERYNIVGNDGAKLLNNQSIHDMGYIYGLDINEGAWKITPYDFMLYNLIKFKATIPIVTSCKVPLSIPIDSTRTLMTNNFMYSNDPAFTIASLIFERNNRIFTENDIITHNGVLNNKGREKVVSIQSKASTLSIVFKNSGVMWLYDIVDMKKFNILLTKYSCLGKE